MKIEEFKEKYKNEDQIGHVMDFLKSKYGHKNSINFNYEQALEKANIWTKRLNEKNKDLKSSSGQVEIIKEFDCGFRIVRLLDQESKNWEGLHMNHCVASYKDHKGIYSLRNQKNIPHCTIEIEDNEIQQIKGKANGRVSPKYVNYVLDFLQSIDFKISNKEIKNLGYTRSIDLEFIKEHFANYKIIKIRNEEFLYVGNQLKLIKNFDSKDPDLLFHFCQFNQCFDAIKLLVKNGTDIHSANDYSLRLASKYGHLDVVKFLVENGADIHAQNNYSLRYASYNGHLNVVKFLVENGANIHSRDDDPLLYASENGHLNIVEFLVKNGANIHSRDDISLFAASYNGHLDIVKFLVENGSKNLNPALLEASENGNLNIVEFLVKNGANIHYKNDFAIVLASRNGYLNVVKFLTDSSLYKKSNLFVFKFKSLWDLTLRWLK